MKCEACEHLTDDYLLIYESDHWRVNLNAEDQQYLGRSFITLKRHADQLSNLTTGEWEDFHQVIKKFESGVENVFKAALVNWSCLMNGGFKTKPNNPHVHWHARPRYDHSIRVKGEVFTDSAFGSHYERSTRRQVPEPTLKLIATKLKVALEKA